MHIDHTHCLAVGSRNHGRVKQSKPFVDGGIDAGGFAEPRVFGRVGGIEGILGEQNLLPVTGRVQLMSILAVKFG